MTARKLDALSDDDLLLHADEVVRTGRRSTAQLIKLLIQIEDRRAHLRESYSSLFEFCMRRWSMSEGTAFRHITAARLARKCPRLVEHIASGAIHLSRVVQLRHVLEPGNVDELVELTHGKSKYEVAEMLAGRAARPDVRGTLRKLPSLRTENEMTPADKARIEPHAESRYRMQMTISREVRDRVERALDLMGHANPKRDLAILFERALDRYLAELEKKRLGPTANRTAETTSQETPKKRERSAAETEHDEPSAETRRRVFARDGEQCTFVSRRGRRCTARHLLEVDHIRPRAEGGTNDEDNLRLRCRAHNGLHAEDAFGKDYVQSRIRSRRRAGRTRAAPA